MSKRPKLRMTNADYVAIAVSPALIMALVGSLVFFLIEVMYVGQYQARLMYVFALFVFATVLIGRISIEMGSERAALFALPLGIAMFLVLAKFVEHASPYSHFINLGLLALIWWSTHKLTWDCTLIDDNEDASGEGLMQRIGVDELVSEDEAQPDNVENELLTGDQATKKKTPHTPGLWVLYFSLAALPLFGIGQKWIPASDLGRRQYAFGLLAVYVAAGLTLLVTTSFLGLRRYLRQRRIEMPVPMATTWVVTGAALIGTVMLLAALIPRPQAEYAISQVPWQARSPSDLASSRRSLGNDGTEDENSTDDSRKVTGDETDPNAPATREGDNPTATSDEGEQQASGEEGQESADGKAQTSEGSQSHDSNESESESEQRADSRDDASTADNESMSSEGDVEPNDDANNDANDGANNDAKADAKHGMNDEAEDQQDSPPPSPASQTAEADSQTSNDSDSNPSSGSPSPPSLLPNLSVLGGLAGILKLALYAVLALAICFLVWRHREQIAKAIADLVRQIREFLAELFGGKRAKPAATSDEASEKASGPPPRPFAAYTDPFASGQHRTLPPNEVVRYTFEAFEAWARERGHPRSPDQTPLELIRQAIPKDSPMLPEAQRLARLYNEAAYAPKSVSATSVEKLASLWDMMRRSSPAQSPQTQPQTPLESVS